MIKINLMNEFHLSVELFRPGVNKNYQSFDEEWLRKFGEAISQPILAGKDGGLHDIDWFGSPREFNYKTFCANCKHGEYDERHPDTVPSIYKCHNEKSGVEVTSWCGTCDFFELRGE